MDYSKKALEIHEEYKGKISVISKVSVANKDELSVAYTPGVAEPCREIAKNKDDVYKYTSKGNLVAVVSDGTAVLGLGDIGPEAAMPVMEGKAVLFKEFAGVDAFPICVDTKDVDEIVDLVKKIAPTFGGINLEDISAPRCIEIERRLKDELDIPVFHDDQHGTAIVTTAGLINSLKLVNKKWEDIKIVVNGSGSAGSAIVKMLLNMNAKNILVCGINGILYEGKETNDELKEEIAKITNPKNEKGKLEDAMKNADVFIGVSAPNVVTKEMVASMNKDAIVFAMANPIPEIMPYLAKEAGARVVGSGRSDFVNQINNVLAFPGIFKGALAVRASDINEEMKVAAANAIAEIIQDSELNEEYIIPKPFDTRIVKAVANAVEKAAVDTGISRI
ncbi:NAD(P)-dependent malic enzyme [Tepidibacter aestuarii]|uniref:NAD(P)-dependent malic enzyme n=1 Tax=Tepidibacter aestuarii TaxID=2925782 RepID=UPI0020BF562E|nr:malic enzyme-like NAD(P)-binding protein [Tepidibacter aestuarii]CAH2212120.1 NADP-dependent malic enzyme (conversion of malate into pyruvate, anabolic) [Tepidibacter aestuarii]